MYSNRGRTLNPKTYPAHARCVPFVAGRVARHQEVRMGLHHGALTPVGSGQSSQRLLTAEEVAAYLQVSKYWVLDHAAGRRRPTCRASSWAERFGLRLA